jgi:hypothetical protein
VKLIYHSQLYGKVSKNVLPSTIINSDFEYNRDSPKEKTFCNMISFFLNKNNDTVAQGTDYEQYSLLGCNMRYYRDSLRF